MGFYREWKWNRQHSPLAKSMQISAINISGKNWKKKVLISPLIYTLQKAQMPVFYYNFLILKIIIEMLLWCRVFFSHSPGKSAGFEQWHSMIATYPAKMQTSTGWLVCTVKPQMLTCTLPYLPTQALSSPDCSLMQLLCL